MNYETYKQDDQNRYLNLLSRIEAFFFSTQNQIDLADPQKRLEDSINKLHANSDSDSKSIEQIFKNELEALDIKFSNSYRRIEEILTEISKNTSNNFNNVRNEMDQTKANFITNFHLIEENLNSTCKDLKTIKVDLTKFQSNFEKLQQEIYNAYLDELNKVKANVTNLMNH